ncbi:MAG: xanthine dehydrogenase family protein subunit M [Elusimicrobia bacterium]|nr:xanthine dehydrogenase family protein subunit M [Elusimicrobiota bacterium]
MRIKELEYHSPSSLIQACRLLKSGGSGAKILAGGTDILPDLKKGRISAASLISLARLNELKKIEGEAERHNSGSRQSSARFHPSTLYPLPSTLLLGPLVTPNMLAGSELVRRIFPGLSEAAGSMAANQIRNLATIGGNLCSAVPSADLPPVLLTVEAELFLTSHAGERRLPLRDFFLGPRRTAIRRTEILTGILIPKLPRGTGTAYERFQARDASALAIAASAARLTVKGGKIVKALVAIGACAPTPLLIEAVGGLLTGKEPSEQNFARAGELAAQCVKPIIDIRGCEQYRREICRVLTIRALKRAFQKAV